LTTHDRRGTLGVRCRRRRPPRSGCIS
jgi:hypothetical protein